MSIQPDSAWVEAAKSAAARAFEAAGAMDNLDLGITVVSQDDANGTNSADRSFLDYLAQGGHLTQDFLANAR